MEDGGKGPVKSVFLSVITLLMPISTFIQVQIYGKSKFSKFPSKSPLARGKTDLGEEEGFLKNRAAF